MIKKNNIKTTARWRDTGLSLTRKFARILTGLCLLLALSPANAQTKALYLYSDPGNNLSRTAPTTPQSTVGISGSDTTVSWTLTPVLSGDIVFDGTDVPVVLWLTETGPGNSRNLTITLRSTDPAAPTLGNLVVTNQALNGVPSEIQFNVPVAASTTVRSGYQIILDVQNNSPNLVFGAFVLERLTHVYPVGSTSNSRVDVQTGSIINVDSVGFYDAAYPSGNLISASVPTGTTVYTRAQVSDPFGSFDITDAQITITDPGSTVVVNGASMSSVYDSGSATKIFEKSYTASGTGTWTVSVTAKEGQENSVTHTAGNTFVTTPAPDISTTTNAVWDINGGTADPGETLRYTITIKESAGYAANNIQVTSGLPTNTTGLTVVSIPGGATNNSTASSLDISGITVPANGSQTIVFDVTISGSASAGDLVDHGATVNNPSGANYVANAPTMIVSASSVPVTGNKPLYLYDNGTMTRTAPTTTQSAISIGEGGSATWNMSPAAQATMTLNSNSGTAYFPVTLWLARTGNFFAGNDRNITVELSSDGAPAGVFGTLTVTKTLTNTRQATLFNIPISNDVTLSAGNTITLTVTNNTTGTGARGVDVYPAVTTDRSKVVLDSNNVINVDSVAFYDTTPAVITSATINTQVNIQAVVSDPFGNADISSATYDLVNPQGVTVVSGGAMTAIATTGSTKTFQSSNSYTIPGSGVGSWTVTVTAKEGLENEVSHSNSTTLGITAPSLTVVKMADVSTVTPGGYITYTVTITNTGNDTASNVVVEDALSHSTSLGVDPFGTGTPFQFTPGTSGLSLGTPVYSSDDGSTYAHPLAGSGYDPDVTNLKIPMSGTMAVGSNFVLRYRLQVK